MPSISTPAMVRSSVRSSILDGRSTNSRSQLTENFMSRVFLKRHSGGRDELVPPDLLCSRCSRWEGRACLVLKRSSFSCELPEKPQIVLTEQPDIWNIEQDHGQSIHAEAEGEAGPC